MEEKLDLVVYIGRFQPFHRGHQSVLDHALTIAHNVLVIIGSCGGARTIKNPFTGDERIDMIRSCYSEEENKRIVTAQAQDYIYDNQKWQEQICSFIDYTSSEFDVETIAITGGAKSEWYFDLLTGFDHIVPEKTFDLDATNIRDIWFNSVSNMYINTDLNTLVPYPVKMFLIAQREATHFSNLRDEYFFIKKYKESWKIAPYPPTFVACDACVVWADRVLLIQRKNVPGKDLWAMPGGFLDQKESMEDCMLRELGEETTLRLLNKLEDKTGFIRDCITKTHLLDFPSRSERGRFISMAYRVDLPHWILPVTEAADDAVNTEWKTKEWIKQNKDKFFEDHYDGIMFLLGD
jgi:bifunctional NMN adenylyltransferase/nudix hydrolase